MNSAFEDCCVLMRSLADYPHDLQRAFISYEQARRMHTDVLADLSKQNFLELRDRVQSPWFLARKRLDVMLNRLWPRLWQPLYTMISHSTIPYSDALARARRQDRIVVVCALVALAAIGSIVLFSIGRRL
jgi:kynurenine 3-monooxygenase